MSRLSLVVPVYNVENYLDACLESLTEQTFSDIEIICVNDGSTDCSRDLLKRWAERDARIRVIDKPNGGPSSARNMGLEIASGDIVCFPDADDRMLPQACERIISIMRETDSDVMTFGAIWVPKKGVEPWLRKALSPRDAIYEGFSPDLLFKENTRPFAWRTACRLSMLRTHNIRFEETLDLGEDQVFQFAIYPRSKRTVLSSERLYEYRVGRPGSLMNLDANNYAQKMLKHVSVVERIFTDWERGGFLREYGPEMVAFALDFALYDALKLDDASYRAVAETLRSVLFRYWSAEELIDMSATPAVRYMAKACCDPGVTSFQRSLIVLARYIQINGLHGLAKMVMKQMGC